MTSTLRISRQQLAAFLKNDHDAIRQFETLFNTVANPDTTATATEPEFQIETAAHEALARIERLERVFQLLEMAPASHIHSISDVNGLQTQIDAISDPYNTTESLTNRKWVDGKSIYRKVLSLGALLNNSTKNVAHGITNIGTWVQLYGVAKDTTRGLVIPLPFATPAGYLYSVSITVDSTNVSVSTGTDRTAFTASYAILEYTKT